MSDQPSSSDSVIEELQKSLGKATGKERAAIYERMGDAYASSNKLQKAIVCYQEAMDIFGPKVRFYDRLGDLLEQLNRSKEATEVLTKGLKELTDPMDLATLHTRMALVMNRRGMLKDGRKEAETVLKILGETKASGPEVDFIYYRIYNVLGQDSSSEGKLDESVANFQKSLEYCQKLKDMKGILNIRNNIGIVLMQMGKLQESIEVLETALLDAEEAKMPTKMGLVLVNIGNTRYHMGDLDAARAACLRCIERCKETDQFYLLAFGQMHLTEIYLEKGDLRNAKRYGERSVLGFKKTGDISHESKVLTILALVAIAEGDLTGADKSLSDVKSKKLKELEPDAQAMYMRSEGLLLMAKGDLKGAERSLLESLELFSSLSMPFEIGQVHANRAKLYETAGRKDEAKSEAALAKKIFSDIGAKAELSKLTRK